jgi:hypothetical protein
VKLNDSKPIFPQRTFIREACMICDCEKHHSISYLHDPFPLRHIFFCDRKNCFLRALSTYIKDANAQSAYPFVKVKDSSKLMWIPRTNGGFSIGKVTERSIPFLHDGRLHVSTTFANATESSTACVSKPVQHHHFDRHKCIPISELKETTASLFDIDHLFARALTCKVHNEDTAHTWHKEEKRKVTAP